MALLWRYHNERKVPTPSYAAADPTQVEIEAKIKADGEEVAALEAEIAAEKEKQRLAEEAAKAATAPTV